MLWIILLVCDLRHGTNPFDCSLLSLSWKAFSVFKNKEEACSWLRYSARKEKLKHEPESLFVYSFTKTLKYKTTTAKLTTKSYCLLSFSTTYKSWHLPYSSASNGEDTPLSMASLVSVAFFCWEEKVRHEDFKNLSPNSWTIRLV